MNKFADDEIPKYFSPINTKAYECIMSKDVFHGSKVYMLAQNETNAAKMFQKQHPEYMQYLKHVKLMVAS